jgi:hypothetical protein
MEREIAREGEGDEGRRYPSISVIDCVCISCLMRSLFVI